MSQRRPELYLIDIVEATTAVGSFVTGITGAESFEEDDLVRSAVLNKLHIVGEAAKSVPVEIRDEHPEVPWRSLIGMRNITVHGYHQIRWEIVWQVASHDAPTLRDQIWQILRDEFPLAAKALDDHQRGG